METQVLQNALGSVGDVALSEKQTRDKDKQNGYNITTHIEPQVVPNWAAALHPNQIESAFKA